MPDITPQITTPSVKPLDCSIVLSDGGFNSAYILRNIVNDKANRGRRIYVMNIQTNPYMEKYIKQQIDFLKVLPVIDIRYFRINNLPESDLSTAELLETYANAAILSFFEQYFALGSDIQVYIGFDSSNYKELNFDEKLKGKINYPLKDKPENFAIQQLLYNCYSLFRLCTNCSNIDEDHQWCNNDDCYDCKYIKHNCNVFNNTNIFGSTASRLRVDFKKWFGIEMAATKEDDKVIINAACGCSVCSNNENTFKFQRDNGVKKLVSFYREPVADESTIEEDNKDTDTLVEEEQ